MSDPVSDRGCRKNYVVCAIRLRPLTDRKSTDWSLLRSVLLAWLSLSGCSSVLRVWLARVSIHSSSY